MEGLRQRGAEPLAFPTIRIVDPSDSQPLRRAVADPGIYDWVIFTSANGVDRFWRELESMGGAPRLPKALRVAAIGPATAEALREREVEAEVVPEEYVAEAVAEELTASGSVRGLRILLPRAAGARKVLPERLRAAGARVDEIVAYEARADEQGIAGLRRAIDAGEVDMVTFTAASTVRCFVEVAGADLGGARVAAIGPITARAARSLGVRVDVEAEEYTVAGLVTAICDYVARAGRS